MYARCPCASASLEMIIWAESRALEGGATAAGLLRIQTADVCLTFAPAEFCMSVLAASAQRALCVWSLRET